jgi:oxalate---CoA ligase
MTAAHATWYTAVPTIHQILLARASSDYPKGGHPSLRFTRSCSAPLAPAVLEELETTFP